MTTLKHWCRTGIGLAAVVVAGCADVHWERAFYDGFQRCPPGNSVQSDACGHGPAYDKYEQDRERLQGKPSPAPGQNPIEEKQL